MNIGIDIRALILTLRLAATTTALLLVIGLPLAAWLAFSRSALKPFIEAIVALPLVLPPTVLGFYLLVAVGPSTAIGRAITHLLGHTLAFSFTGLVLGSILYSLPFAVQPFAAGFASVDPALIDAATLLGSGPVETFRRVILPSARNSILAGTVLAFTHTVGEFGVVLMIGGNLPGATRTLSIALYDQVQDFQYTAASRTAGILLIAALLTLTILYAHRRRSRIGARLV